MNQQDGRSDDQLVFDANGTLRVLSSKRTSPDAVTALSIADGFYGPRFDFRLDNGSHQGGSHIHLYARSRGGYALTDVCFTRTGNEVIAYKHCEGTSTVSIDSLSTNAIRRLERDGLTDILGKEKDWTRSVDQDKVIAVFPLYSG